MDEKVRWTNLKPWQIAQLLDKEYEIQVSLNVIRQLLKKHDYRRRKAQKRVIKQHVRHRNEQFENILRLKGQIVAPARRIPRSNHLLRPARKLAQQFQLSQVIGVVEVQKE